jgi:hypothetical protein
MDFEKIKAGLCFEYKIFEFPKAFVISKNKSEVIVLVLTSSNKTAIEDISRKGWPGTWMSNRTPYSSFSPYYRQIIMGVWRL